MGNRGILHDASGRLGRARWRHSRWIACRLEFCGRRRAVMSRGTYTELFFLDEAVALAAGHRPCAECRREDYRRFLDTWRAATDERPGADELDRHLHAARIVRGTRRQATFRAAAKDLPDGTFITHGEGAHVVVAGLVLPFTPGGYLAPAPSPAGEVEVLTPLPTVEVLRAGYRPELHATARV